MAQTWHAGESATIPCKSFVYNHFVIASSATSAVASSIYGLIQTHPNDPSRPLVDFDVALTFIPALLLGVSFGASSPCIT